MSSCPNCQHAISPGDDICENCGAVLSAQVTSQGRFVAALSTPLPTISSGASTSPTCNTSVKAGEDICENCGMVLSASISSGALARTVTPLKNVSSRQKRPPVRMRMVEKIEAEMKEDR